MDEQIQAGVQFISPAQLLAEAGGTITRRTGLPDLGKQAVTLLENLPGLRLVEMDNRLMSMASQLAAQHGLRGADAVYAATAYLLGLPLLTFDIDQRQRAVEIVKIYSV